MHGEIQTYKESGNLSTWAADINHHHEQACLRAGEAINHAIEAGKVLMRVKSRLPHGEFGNWVQANIRVTQRQAQRYIAAAEGKPIPVRAITSNTTSVSHLPKPAKTDTVPVLSVFAAIGEPETEAPPEYTELDRKDDLINELQSELVVARMGDIPEDQKTQAAERIAEQDAQIKTLTAVNRALVLSRYSLMYEVSEMKKQMAGQRREIDKLKAIGHPAGE